MSLNMDELKHLADEMEEQRDAARAERQQLAELCDATMAARDRYKTDRNDALRVAAEEVRRQERYRLAYTSARLRARQRSWETAGVRGQLAECYAELARAERYRLAWMSARARAAAFAGEADDADDERDLLRISLQERDEELAAALGQVDKLLAERHETLRSVEIMRNQRNACLQANSELRGERDEIRAQFVELGRESERAEAALLASVKGLQQQLARPVDDDLRGAHHTVTTPYECLYQGAPDRRVGPADRRAPALREDCGS